MTHPPESDDAIVLRYACSWEGRVATHGGRPPRLRRCQWRATVKVTARKLAHGAAMGMWIVWLVVAAVLGAAEIMTATLAFGLVAISAFVAAGVGFAGGNGAMQFGAFAIASAAGLGIARPFAMRHIRQPPMLRTGTAALVGRTAIVLDEVTGQSGRVRIGGEEWSARSYDETLTIPAGTKVDVMQIEGANALVYPRE